MPNPKGYDPPPEISTLVEDCVRTKIDELAHNLGVESKTQKLLHSDGNKDVLSRDFGNHGLKSLFDPTIKMPGGIDFAGLIIRQRKIETHFDLMDAMGDELKHDIYIYVDGSEESQNNIKKFNGLNARYIDLHKVAIMLSENTLRWDKSKRLIYVPIQHWKPFHELHKEYD
jgi:hypothetical protein